MSGQGVQMIAGLGFLVLLGFAKSGLGALTISSKPAHIVANRGEPALLPCEIDGPGYSNWFNPIVWYKILENGEKIQINNMAAISEPFASTKRYTLTPEQSDSKVVLSLHINNVTVAEDGSYLCTVKDGDNYPDVSHTIVVPAAIESLTLTTNRSRVEHEGNETKVHFEFQERQPAYVGCVSKGGNPKPVVKMFRGRVDVTGDFNHDIVETVTGPKGLEEVKYEIALVRHAFVPDIMYSGHNLKCVSKVPKTGKKDKHITHKQTRVATMDIRYAPVIDCERDWAAFVSTQKYKMECVVHANPQVELDTIYWKIGGVEDNATRIDMGETVDGVSANISVDRLTDRVKVSLMFEQVNASNFNSYVLRVRNAVGEILFHTHLSLATTTQSTTTTKRPNVVIKETNPTYKHQPGKPGSVTGGAGGHLTLNLFISTVTLFLAIICLQHH